MYGTHSYTSGLAEGDSFNVDMKSLARNLAWGHSLVLFASPDWWPVAGGCANVALTPIIGESW
jgi:hypothetical protein